CDFGHDFDQHTVIYTGDEVMDLFVFLGQPKDVLGEYTALTGRSPVPPLWSFGLWMSRITYKAEAEVRDVAAKLRRYLIPSDVIHLDTGWFETDWRSDYEFSTTRFANPRAMIADLGHLGFHISLWQYPYFTRKNRIWTELLEGGYGVRNEGGRIAPEDATLDFSNADAVRWYQGKLKSLLDLGVGVIKADFGEGAPLTGVYASGRTGWYEHNLYPVRYNKAAWEITKRATGDGIIWGRSAWAKASAANGYPMLRTLFFEYPDDPTSWLIEDEYLFGSDLLVAPLFEEADHRNVYLPPGSWIDYQTGRVYSGAVWHDIPAGPI